MAKWKPLDQMTYLGKRYPRVDGPVKVAGAAKYTYDVNLPGMLYGAILSSPHPAAKIKGIDASKARALPGVKTVLTDVHPTGTVRYVGEEVAALAATSIEAARDALELIQVDYELLPFTVDLDAAMQPGAPRVFADQENIRDARKRGEGDVDAGFAQAAAVVEQTYRTQVQVHACLETHGSVAKWDGDQLTVWDSTQGVHPIRDGLATALNIPATNIRVICEYMGGGFGSKLQTGSYSAIAARLAKAANAPVKLMLTRPQDSQGAGNRPSSIQHLKAGASKDGKLVAFSVKGYGTAGIATGAGFRSPIVYDVPNWRAEIHDVYTNAGEARAFRAPGCPQGSFGMESMMDELAEKLGIEPLEFRLKNDSNATRQKQWKVGAERFGWVNRRKAPGADRGPRKRGVGLGAAIWWPGGRGTQAEMTIMSDGSLVIRCGTQDLGTGTRTYVASVVAEELGLRISDVKAMIGDTNYPVSGGSGGSTTVPSVAPAIKNTSEKAKDRLLDLAAQHFGVTKAEMSMADGKTLVTANPAKSLSWKQLCSLLGADPLVVHGEWVEGLSSAGVAGCQFAEVEVDTETGQVQVMRIVAVQDCGLVLDRLTTESQVNGAVIQGLSYALFEDRVMDPVTGHLLNRNLENYKIAGALESPQIEVILTDQPERGVIGIGEPPTVPTAAAIANAVYNAIGVRIRSLPMTPDKVLMALNGASRKEN